MFSFPLSSFVTFSLPFGGAPSLAFGSQSVRGVGGALTLASLLSPPLVWGVAGEAIGRWGLASDGGEGGGIPRGACELPCGLPCGLPFGLLGEEQ